MKVNIVGGGPGGLYLATLLKRRNPQAEIHVFERNRMDDTFGFGVVFSDATLDGLRDADEETYSEIARNFARWDDIDIHYRGQRLRSTGHGFAGLSRRKLLDILADRADQLGAQLHFETEVTDIESLRDADLLVGADGLNSLVRQTYESSFKPTIDLRPNRFVWLGTSFPYDAFTFYFKDTPDGLFRVHAYRYSEERSTFIVECTAETAAKIGWDGADEAQIAGYCTDLFKQELDGHPLFVNRSFSRQFPTVQTERWAYKNVVLVGDAVHTAHFSIGSGTKLAMEDAIALVDALDGRSIPEALQSYETERRPGVESTQRAAQVSLEWFENTERYMGLDPIRFGFGLLTRSLRVTHDGLKRRDPAYVAEVDRWFQGNETGETVPPEQVAAPPMFAPYQLREMVLPNRIVVSPMCMYSATDGAVNDFTLVHLGSRAIGGAGLILTEMTDVSADARITPGCAGLYTDAHTREWKRIVDFVHGYSDGKIGMQLGHAGRKGATKRMWEGIDQPLDDGAWPLLSASALPYLPNSQVPKAMDAADMAQVQADFVRSAQMADAAGFDMLELHAAHGYLLASFISPLTNQRTDGYGGSLENRARFPLEVFSAIRAVWPATKPISVRISAVDWADGGTTIEESIQFAGLLKIAGADIIDVSAGMTVRDAKPEYGRLYQCALSERIRLAANMPTMTVGNISSYTDVNTILAAGRADLCVLARAHLYDPYWTRHAAQTLEHALPWPQAYSAIDRYNPRFT